MRILYIGWGQHVHVIRWMEQFAGRGESVSVLNVGERHQYRQPIRQFMNPVANRRMSIQHLWTRLVIALSRAQLIHVHWLHFLAMVPPSWKGPIVVTGWGSDLYQSHKHSAERRAALAFNLKRVSWFTVDSEDQRKVLMDEWGVPGDKIGVVQWGVDLTTFKPGPDVAERDNVIYSCRAITPIYNQDVIMRAFAKVRESVPDARLVIKTFLATEPPLSEVLGLIDELELGDSVEVLESLPYEELPALYHRAKLCVSVPTTDGTPMTVLETMACGSLPVFSNLPSLQEWIVDGDNGYLSDPKDVDMLADRMLQAIRLDAGAMHRIVADNMALVRDRADHHAHMDHVHEQYRQLTGTRS